MCWPRKLILELLLSAAQTYRAADNIVRARSAGAVAHWAARPGNMGCRRRTGKALAFEFDRRVLHICKCTYRFITE
jgi:hypothetical protein